MEMDDMMKMVMRVMDVVAFNGVYHMFQYLDRG